MLKERLETCLFGEKDDVMCGKKEPISEFKKKKSH